MLYFKFSLFFIFIFISIQQTKFPKNIWVYWSRGQIPPFTKICLQNMKSMTQKDGWKINIVNDINIYDYIDDDYYFDYIINHKVLTTNVANKADIVRLFLMYQNGGIWFDISSILTEDLTWLDEIATNPSIYNRKQAENLNQYPDVLLFMYQHFGSKKEQNYWKNGQKVLATAGFQTWFIACVPKARLLYQWKKQFTQYFMKDYYTYFDNAVKLGVSQRNLDYNNYMVTSGALQNVIQTKQREIDQNTPYLQGQQYAVHYYKLWTMWAVDKGPLFYQTFVWGTPVYITRYSKQYLAQQQRLHRYFVKVVRWDRQQIDPMLDRVLSDSFIAKPSMSADINCSSPLMISKGSIIDIYLLKHLPLQKYNLLELIDYNQYKKTCSDLSYYLDPFILRIIQIFPYVLFSIFILIVAWHKDHLAVKILKSH